MQVISIQAAKAQLSRLVDEAAAGNEIIIGRAGKPLARLVALAPASATERRVLDRLAGQLVVPENFDAPLPTDMLDALEGH